MSETQKIRVKLNEACYVDRVLCQKGDIVLMPYETDDDKKVAKTFGEIQRGDTLPEPEEKEKK